MPSRNGSPLLQRSPDSLPGQRRFSTASAPEAKPAGLGGVLPIHTGAPLSAPAASSGRDPRANAAASDYFLQQMQLRMSADDYLGAPNISTTVNWAYLRDDGVKRREAQGAVDRIYEAAPGSSGAELETNPRTLGDNAWNSKAHRCGELALAIAHRASTLGHEARAVGAEPHHGFAVFGSLDKNVRLEAPIASWPPHLSICDAQWGISCPPNRYAERLTERASDMEAAGVVVHTGTQFTRPHSGGWLTDTLNATYA